MATFRLVKGAGPHAHQGKIYHPGDEVESDAPLHHIFQNKFELVDGDVEDADSVEEKEAKLANQRTKTPYDTPDTKKHPPIPVFEEKDGPVGDEETAGAGEGDGEDEESEEGDENKPARAPQRRASTSSRGRSSRSHR